MYLHAHQNLNNFTIAQDAVGGHKFNRVDKRALSCKSGYSGDYFHIPQGRRRIRIKGALPMRIDDIVSKSVGFVVEYINLETTGDQTYELEGTGFFVGIPSEVLPGEIYHFFVSAKHTIKKLINRKFGIIVNKKGGGRTVLNLAGNTRWFIHPDDSVDVALIPCSPKPEEDIAHVSIESFLTPELIHKYGIGIGDEVYMPGLFTIAPGSKRNIPLLRHGIISMFPDEAIQVDEGFADVYLIEAHSIGGMSGSPVYVRRTITLPGGIATSPNNEIETMSGLGSRVYLLGLIHGHWDIKEEKLNDPKIIPVKQQGVNMGIGVVVPAQKIMEILKHPELVRLIDQHEATLRKTISPIPD